MSSTQDRRRQILAFVTEYVSKNGHGPRTCDIERAIGYQGHALRENHLDRMPSLRSVGRQWVLAQEEKPIGLIHPSRTDRKYIPQSVFATVWHRGVASLAGQLALLVDEGKDTSDVQAMLDKAREVEEWLQ